MTDCTRLIARVTLVFAILIGTSACARAQYAWGYSGVYYDSDMDWIGAFGITEPDYSTMYYYEPRVHLILEGSDGSVDYVFCEAAYQCDAGDYAWAGLMLPPTPGATYTVTAYHYIDVYYTYEVVDPECQYACSDWYDIYGYTYGLCDPECIPPCFCVDVYGTYNNLYWFPPAILALGSVVQQYLGLTNGSIAASLPILACTPGSVTRGTLVACRVTGPASTKASWSFSGGGATVSGPSAASSWSGQMVVSGTVTATIASWGQLQAGVTVTARTGWHTEPASAVQVANGTMVVKGKTVILPVPPQKEGDDSGLGKFGWDTAWTVPEPVRLSSGPNAGFAYYLSNVNYSRFIAQYIINPDLEDQGSTFSQSQFIACGYISWDNLLTQTRRHEYNHPTQSHYGKYVSAMNDQANNPGDYIESTVAKPGKNLIEFRQETNNDIGSQHATVESLVNQQPYAVNYSADGTPLGNVNYAPYATCQ